MKNVGFTKSGAETGSEAFEVDIQPDATALRMFQSMSFTPWYALGEFVDNAITSALKNIDALRSINGPGYRLRIRIFFSDDDSTLTIEDNAAGIDRLDMQRALRTGQPPSDISVGLSRHGVGMKAAAFWWGQTLEILTYPIGGQHGWKAVIDVSGPGEIKREVVVHPIPMRPSGPGTVIRVSGLVQNKPQRRTKGAIRQYLPSIYRAFLGGGTGAAELDCDLEYEGQLLTYQSPELLTAQYWASKDETPPSDAPEIYWRRNFKTTLESGKTVTGWYGLLQTMGRDRSGFFLHYRRNGIAGVVPMLDTESTDKIAREGAKDSIARSSYKPRDIFGQAGSRRDQSIIGEFDISDFGKTISTDFPLWNPSEEEEFVQTLLADMTADPAMNFIRMAMHYPRRRVSVETATEITSANAKEGELIEGALNATVEHEAVSPETPQDEHPVETIGGNDGVAPEGQDLEYRFVLEDSDNHQHEFLCRLIADRSADLFSVQRGDDRHHIINVNRLHPVLDDVPESADLLKILQRVAVSLGAAEVFLTMQHKVKVRQKMNEYLGRIGYQVEADA